MSVRRLTYRRTTRPAAPPPRFPEIRRGGPIAKLERAAFAGVAVHDDIRGLDRAQKETGLEPAPSRYARLDPHQNRVLAGLVQIGRFLVDRRDANVAAKAARDPQRSSTLSRSLARCRNRRVSTSPYLFFANGFAISRAQSTKSRTIGLKVRFFRVTTPTGYGSMVIFTGRILTWRAFAQ